MNPLDLGLPHREPFLFIDEVTTLSPGVSAEGRKVFSGNEAFFAGHFPGRPLVPGVILTEALAQLAGIVGASAEPGAAYLLTAVRLMKFPSAALPGEEIELVARCVGEMAGLVSFDVVASVCGRAVAQGQVVLAHAPA